MSTLPTVERFGALLQPLHQARRKATAINDAQLAAQLLTASQDLPRQEEFKTELDRVFFANRRAWAGGGLLGGYLNPQPAPHSLTDFGLEEISEYLADHENQAAVDSSPLLDVLQALIAKGYGRLQPEQANQTRQNPFLTLVGQTSIFPQWVKQQDPEHFRQFMDGASLDTRNVHWLLENRPALAEDPRIFITLCLRLGNAMNQTIPLKNWQEKKIHPEPSIQTITDIAHAVSGLQTHVKTMPPEIKIEGWYGVVGKNALLHPVWTRSCYGANPAFSQFSISDSLDNLKPGSNFMTKSSANPQPWEQEAELFRQMLSQLPYLGDIGADLASLDSAVLFSIYLEHPLLPLGPRLNHRGQALKIVENLPPQMSLPPEKQVEHQANLQKVEGCIEQMHQLGSRLAAFDLYHLARAGASLPTVAKALTMSYPEENIKNVSFPWLVEANRPELLSLFPENQIRWSQVGAHLPKNTINLNQTEATTNNTAWQKIIEGPNGKQVRNGFFCARILEQGVGAPEFVRKHPWLRDQELGDTILESGLLGQLGKRANIHTALETASALRLPPATMSQESSACQRQRALATPQAPTLLELAASSSKPNFLLRYKDLGGSFTSRGAEAAIESKKPQNLEILLTAPSGVMKPELPEKYLKNIDDRISPTFLKLVKLCRPEPLSLLRALSGHPHHRPDLELLYGLMLEQSNPQELLTSMVQQGGPLCEQNPELLRQAIYQGADPTKQVWIYDYNGFQPHTLSDLLPQIRGSHGSDLGRELLDVYHARQQAHQALKQPEVLAIELF